MNGAERERTTTYQENRESQELNEREIAKLLRFSFYYGQGNPILQQMFFREISALRPSIRVPATINESAFVMSQFPAYREFLTKGPHMDVRLIDFGGYKEEQQKSIREVKQDYGFDTDTDAIIGWFIRAEFRMMKAVFDGPTDVDKASRVVSLMTSMIRAEHERLHHAIEEGEYIPKDRPRSGPSRQHGAFRKNKSYFASYVLRGEAAPGPAIYEEIMAEMRDLLKNDGDVVKRLNREDKTTLFKIRDLIRRDRGDEASRAYLGAYPVLAHAIAMLPEKRAD